MSEQVSADSPKPIILLCWGYHRKGWVEPFEQLSDRFTFVYLFNNTPAEDGEIFCTGKIIYWADFDSPFEILDQIKPQKVVFMGIYTALAVALNAACRKKKVPTYLLQHGLCLDYSAYRFFEKLKRKQPAVSPAASKIQTQGRGQVLAFLKSALHGFELVKLPFMLLYFFLAARKGVFYAARRFKFRSRLPDNYICYSRKNARLHVQIDDAPDSKMVFTGPPEYDKFFRNEQLVNPVGEKYFLLIDQPLAQNQYYSFGISPEQVNEFYLKLAVFCKSQGAKLVVKLHPENYQDTWLVRHSDIVYAREEYETSALIKNAEGCFGTLSTLLIPAVYFRPTILFRLFDSHFQEDLIRLGVVAELDYFAFQPEEINFNKVKHLGGDSPEFIRDYLYKDDGKAVERLGAMLQK